MKLERYPLFLFGGKEVTAGDILNIEVPKNSVALRPYVLPDGVYVYYAVPDAVIINGNGEGIQQTETQSYTVVKTGMDIPFRYAPFGIVDVVTTNEEGQQAILVIAIFKFS